MNKVNIFVATHKPDLVYSDDVYIPIHVGRNISKYREKMNHMIGDDSGDNISCKNPFYCECTAQYWMWKNVESSYVGLCHYRRYFETKITSENIDKLMKNKDVILAEPIIDRRSMATKLLRASCEEDYYIFLACIKKLYPNYYNTAIHFLNNNKCIGYNMFIMRKTDFNNFAEWQFNILSEMENNVRLSGYTRMRRIYGYMAEMLLPIYCIHNKLRIKYMPIVSMQNERKKKEILRPLKNIYNNIVFWLLREKIVHSDAVLVGLKNDNIPIFNETL